MQLSILLQGQPYGSAVDEGSVVCLGLDEPLGRIQEVFGPVQAPLYALLYAGGTSMPDTLVPGAAVLAVERLSQFVSTDQLRMPEVSGTARALIMINQGSTDEVYNCTQLPFGWQP